MDWRRSDWIGVSSEEEYKKKRQGKNGRAMIEEDWDTINKWKKAIKNIGQVRKRSRMKTVIEGECG